MKSSHLQNHKLNRSHSGMLPTLVAPPRSIRGVNDKRANEPSQADPYRGPIGVAVVPTDKIIFLRQGCAIVGVGILSALLMKVAYGGMTHSGPRDPGDWLLLMISIMCLPFGLLLLAIGTVAKMKTRFSGRR